jgi:glycosyltransferase involved in cell wall biosynthesis
MKYFFYVGNAYPHKNLRRVIQAVVELNRRPYDKFIFAIASPRNIFTDRLEREIKNLGAGKYIKLLNFVPDEDLRVLYKNSLAFVYASLSEGFGLQIAEAIVSDALVIASDIPVFREVYQDNVLYFDPYDSGSILNIMQKVLEIEYDERRRLISSGKDFIKRYSWTKMAEETLKVYNILHQV